MRIASPQPLGEFGRASFIAPLWNATPTGRIVERAEEIRRSRRALKAFGPDVACPVERRWSSRSRVANAMPIEVSLKRFPLGAMTSAPDFRHRLASGTSEVTTIALGSVRSAIQSSVPSGSAPISDNPSSSCPPWQPDQSGSVGDRRWLRSYTTPWDTII